MEEILDQINPAPGNGGNVIRQERDGMFTLVDFADLDAIFEVGDGVRYLITGWQ